MNYLILSQPSEAYAESISRSLWALSRPEHVRDAKDASKLYTSWLVHTDGRVALYLPNEFKPVHPQGDIQAFTQLVNDPNVYGETINDEGDVVEYVVIMSKHLEALRGGKVNPLQLIQATAYAVNLRTRTEMEADGWFPSEDI